MNFIRKLSQWAGDIAQVVVHLPSKHKVPSSNTSTAKKERQEGKKEETKPVISSPH
jgi:hypothetical protein